MNARENILKILDCAAESFYFPMLDNGYLYLAATRLSLFAARSDWALAIEIFGFSPRAGLPDLSVWTYASSLRDRDPPEKYHSRDAYENHLKVHPNDDARFFYPIADGPWQDAACDELVADDAEELVLRGRKIEIPGIDGFKKCGVALSEAPRICVFELCRYLAATHRDQVLATPGERRVSVPEQLDDILTLDDWHHPDIAASELPSQTECFNQLASVLASGDVTEYRPTEEPNTHWQNWPDGGLL